MENNEKSDWLRNKLVEIFEEKLTLFNENYQKFKNQKKELKADYITLNENCKEFY